MDVKKKSTAVDKLFEAWNDNPLTVIGVGVAAMAAFAKLIEAAGSLQTKRAYAKDVNRRVKLATKNQTPPWKV